MKTRYQPVEVTSVDPRVQQLQARAEAYLRQGPAEGWGLALPARAQQQPVISAQIQNWQNPVPQELPASGQAGTPIQGGMDDRELLAKTLMAEAGAEGYDGLLAAGAVIANRVHSGKFGNGLRGVIMKPGQFSAWNSVTGYAGGEGGLNMDRIRPSKSAYRAADAIISGNYQSPVGNRTHYYNPSIANPAWGARAGGDWLTIGNHTFGWG